MGLFDHITFDDTEGEKAAEVITDPSVGDDGIGKSVNTTDEGNVDDSNKTTEEKKADDAATSTDTQNKTTEDTKTDDKKETDDTATKLPPFHEHPDWVKMQEKASKADELEKTVAHMQGQIDAMMKSKETTVEEKKAAVKTAEERIEEDLANGWKPASQLEISLRGMKYLREEMNAQQEAEKAKQAEENKKAEESENVRAAEMKEFEDNVVNTFTELKLDDDAKQKVAAQVKAWGQAGLFQLNKNNVAHVIKHAHDTLSSKGLLTTSPDKTENKAEMDKKKEVNNKINRGGSNDKSKQPEKKPASLLRRSLDDVVYQFAENN